MTNIQAIDLLKGLGQSLDNYYGLNDEGKTAFQIAITALELFGNTEQLPSAQTEIIRCKDCKHRPVDSEDTQGFGVEFPDEKCPCQCDDGWYNWRPDDEWFCANAERRTDEQIC